MHDRLLNLLIKSGAVATVLVVAMILYVLFVEMPNQDIRHKAYVDCLDKAYHKTTEIRSSEEIEYHYHKFVGECMIQKGYHNGKLFAD